MVSLDPEVLAELKRRHEETGAPMAELVRGDKRLLGGRPVVFKSAGMSWEDLVLAQAIAEAAERRG